MNGILPAAVIRSFVDNRVVFIDVRHRDRVKVGGFEDGYVIGGGVGCWMRLMEGRTKIETSRWACREGSSSCIQFEVGGISGLAKDLKGRISYGAA